MNEILFITHIFVVILATLIALRVHRYALVSLIALHGILANLFVVKQISLFGLAVTCSDVYAVGGILGLNLLQEHYGKESAKQALWASFLGLVFFAISTKIHLFYQPHVLDTTQQAFERILSPSFRICIASFCVYLFVQKIDLLLFEKIRSFFKGAYLPLRIAISLFLTQMLDTILFSFAGLYGIVASIFDVILMSYVTKCAIITCYSLFLTLAQRRGKRVPI